MIDFKIIESKAKKFFEGSNGSHDWDHTVRVLNTALHIGKKEKADLKVLKLAVLLHDIERKYEMKSKGGLCHAEKGAELAKELLERQGLHSGTIDEVIHCIKTHRNSKGPEPESIEAKVLFDADKLDSLGSIGVGRLFLFAGHYDARLHNPEVDPDKVKTYTKEDTAYREFMVKTRFLKDKFLTAEGKRIAQERYGFMAEFFGRLNKEVEGKL